MYAILRRVAARWAARSERGASAVEYGLLVAGVALAMIASAMAFGTVVEQVFQNTCNEVASASPGASTC